MGFLSSAVYIYKLFPISFFLFSTSPLFFMIKLTTETAIEQKQNIKTKQTFRRLHRLYFKARLSSFDSTNPESNSDTFRGFYTLFWIAMGFYVILTLIRCYEQDGVVLSLGFFRLMSRDTLALLCADMAMIAQTFVVLPFAHLLKNGYIRPKPTGSVLQHTFQTIFLFSNLYWVFWR